MQFSHGPAYFECGAAYFKYTIDGLETTIYSESPTKRERERERESGGHAKLHSGNRLVADFSTVIRIFMKFYLLFIEATLY